MAHNHGNEYQIRVIQEDGAEVLSEWIEHEDVTETMLALSKPQAKASWLRERRAKVATCPICQEREPVIIEYPFVGSFVSPSRLLKKLAQATPACAGKDDGSDFGHARGPARPASRPVGGFRQRLAPDSASAPG